MWLIPILILFVAFTVFSSLSYEKNPSVAKINYHILLALLIATGIYCVLRWI